MKVVLMWEEVVVWSVFVVGQTMGIEMLFVAGVVFGLKVEFV